MKYIKIDKLLGVLIITIGIALVLTPVQASPPTYNIALATNGAVVSEGFSTENLIDGQTTRYTNNRGFAYNALNSSMTVKFYSVYTINEIHVLLWDLDDRYYQYKVETSINNLDWTTVVDKTSKTWSGWQNDTINPIDAKYLRIVGTNNSVNGRYHIVEIEAYTQNTPPQSTSTTGVEIGNMNYHSYYPHQNNPKLTFDLISNLGDIRSGTTVAWQVYKQPFDLTDFTLVQSRFDMASANKDYNWDYGVFVLSEEVFNPVLQTIWNPSSRGLSTWQIDDTATFAGIEVKLIKPWYIAKYGSWNQGWWDNVKSSNNYNDPIVKEWNAEFTYKLYMAWHQHMRNLGKKSAIIGLVGIRDADISSAFENYCFPSPSWEYVMANYDMVFTYMYPRTLNEVARSEIQVMDLREKYNYQGKIAHILTTKFNDGMGSTDQTIAQEEFSLVYPHVNYIIGYPFMDVSDWNNPSIPYAPILIGFQEGHI